MPSAPPIASNPGTVASVRSIAAKLQLAKAGVSFSVTPSSASTPVTVACQRATRVSVASHCGTACTSSQRTNPAGTGGRPARSSSSPVSGAASASVNAWARRAAVAGGRLKAAGTGGGGMRGACPSGGAGGERTGEKADTTGTQRFAHPPVSVPD